MIEPITRRQFIASSSLAAASLALGLGPRAYAQSQGANNRIVLGLIGCGGMGRANLKSFMDIEGVEVGALCDVDAKHLDETVADVVGAGRRAPRTYRDFRKLLEQRDIDAVIIGTPDHWHALPFIAACEAGKDIYCEKPISHSVAEAKAMVAAARHFKRVVQVGTWQRSMPHYQQALEFIHSGKLGEITVCRAWFVNPVGGWIEPIGHQTPTTPPPELDWDLWLGPAPKKAYAANRCHFNWRWFYDTGGGLMTDWGVHLIDIALLGMQQSDPVSVHSIGGRFLLNDDGETPDTMQTVYRFPKWLLNWEVRLNNGRGLDGGRDHGTEFVGTKGTLVVDREGYQYFPEDRRETVLPPPAKMGAPNPHWQNFLDCMRTRATPTSGIESMAKTTIVCQLGNIAYQTGRTIYWDAAQQDVRNRRDAKRCATYHRDYRAPWKLKTYGA